MSKVIDIKKLESSIIWCGVKLEESEEILEVMQSLRKEEEDPMELLKLDADMKTLEQTVQVLRETYEKDIATRKVLYT